MKTFSLLLISLLIQGSITSCTKTEALTPLAQNRILEYKVTNLPDTVIYGAIDNIDNSITVYVPYYFSLSVIEPAVTLSAGARLSTEALPVSITDSTTSYEVKGADGSSRTYKLHIVQQNPSSLKADWSPSVEEQPVGYPNNAMPLIAGNFNSHDLSTAVITLTSVTSGKSVTVAKEGASIIMYNGEEHYLMDGLVLPADIDTGFYKVTIRFLGNQAALSRNIHVIHKQPAIAVTTQTVTQGGTITYDAYLSILQGFTKASATLNGITYSLPVEKATLTQLTLRIPDNFPAGDYSGSLRPRLILEFTGWSNISRSVPLIVNPK